MQTAIDAGPVVLSAPDYGLALRKALTAVTGSTAGALALVAVYRHETIAAAAPWYATIILTTALALAGARNRQTDPLAQLLPLKAREPVSLNETFTLTYLCAASAMFLLFELAKVSPPDRTIHTPQIVDIQLISDADYQDRQLPLPGTREKTALRRRVADLETVQGQLYQSPVKVARSPAPEPKAPAKARQEARKSSSSSTDRASAPGDGLTQGSPPASIAGLALPPSWSTRTFGASSGAAARLDRSSEPEQTAYLCEVQPRELVELVDNDGDNNALDLFQEGGKSTGGSGRENDLSRYLKELNKRIKGAWEPPRGCSKRVELLFRIKRDGTIAFIKVTGPSGEKDTDSSTVQAVTTALARPMPLPDDYQRSYLDIKYTFRYSVDELEEIPAP